SVARRSAFTSSETVLRPVAFRTRGISAPRSNTCLLTASTHGPCRGVVSSRRSGSPGEGDRPGASDGETRGPRSPRTRWAGSGGAHACKGRPGVGARAGTFGGGEGTEMLSHPHLSLERTAVLLELGRAGPQQVHADHVHRSVLLADPAGVHFHSTSGRKARHRWLGWSSLLSEDEWRSFVRTRAASRSGRDAGVDGVAVCATTRAAVYRVAVTRPDPRRSS